MDALVALYRSADALSPVSVRDMMRGQANLLPQFVQFNRCRHVLIDDCVFDQGDDPVSVKSGRDRDAWRLGTPSRNIVMRNCRVKNGHQIMAIGSELSGGIENVFVDNCHFDDAGPRARTAIMNLLYVKTNERRGGYVRNIYMNNVSATRITGGILCVETDVLYQWRRLMPTNQRRLTPITGLHVSNVQVAEAQFVCQIKGQAELPVHDVSLRDLRVGTLRGVSVLNEHVEGFVYDTGRKGGA